MNSQKPESYLYLQPLYIGWQIWWISQDLFYSPPLNIDTEDLNFSSFDYVGKEKNVKHYTFIVIYDIYHTLSYIHVFWPQTCLGCPKNNKICLGIDILIYSSLRNDIHRYNIDMFLLKELLPAVILPHGRRHLRQLK